MPLRPDHIRAPDPPAFTSGDGALALPDFAPPVELTHAPTPLAEPVPVPAGGDGCPAELRHALVIDCVHDGWYIPEAYWEDHEGFPIEQPDINEGFQTERDWGAALVAGYLAEYLGLDSYLRVNVARVLMDFGRFPGSTVSGADHMQRFAINYPFSRLLSHEQKRSVLEDCYDEISSLMDVEVRGRFIKFAIHTMDTYDRNGRLRPQTSIITQAMHSPGASAEPGGAFDPLYPERLGEFTSDRILRDRVSLTLEKARIPVAHNYPYKLPEGSIEVRAQVWFFFTWLRRRFEEAFPDTADDPSYRKVWRMLLDTNRRSQESDALRGYLHLFRRPEAGREREFQLAQRAYQHVCIFSDSDHGGIIEQYRFSPDRPSSLGIEIRKDLVWEFDSRGRPVAPKVDAARTLGRLVGEAVSTYIRVDRAERFAGSTYRFTEGK